MFTTLSDSSVIVIRGGRKSSHREHSLRSGSTVYHSLRKDHDTHDIHIHTDGSFLASGQEVKPQKVLQSHATIFNALHGEEAGQIAHRLQRFRSRFTGNTRFHQSHLKLPHAVRRLFRRVDIQTIPHWKFRRNTSVADGKIEDSVLDHVDFPVVIFPLAKHHSNNRMTATSKTELRDILSQTLESQSTVYAQKGIHGRIYSVIALSHFREQKPYVFPPFENLHDHRLANMVDISDDDYSRTPPKAADKLQALAEEIYKAAGLRCVARINILKTSSGDKYLWRIDTHPRLDRHSLLATATERVGALLQDVFRAQVQSARHQRS